jgi:putative SOS response-associated peptidase YedK
MGDDRSEASPVGVGSDPDGSAGGARGKAARGVNRYTLTSLDGIAASFGAAAPAGSAPRFNIAPLQLALVRTADGVVGARWGLLPPWRGHGGKRGPHVLHAPLDAIEATPLLRNAFKSQRCLVIADGFFVWRRGGKKPGPVWIHPAPSRLVAFAGLAATHRDDGQLSFAIIVGPASPLVASQLAPAAPADLTMPLVIAADGYATWLTGSRDAARDLLGHAPTGWRADPVSNRVNAVEHDDPACVELLGNPAQGELF